ncbi:MAG: NAD-dependent epimerase/dehydratase family protein [Deltaproteobacteria bacterium]|nr:NAD-dependent epimerase/dehydratase family protein [Deltaproteobacteria bacterium]
MKPSILITGASSSLMNAFIDIIDFGKYDVCAITRNPQSISNPNIHVLEGDICDRNFTRTALKNVYAVFHAAAVTHAFNKQDYDNVNVKGTRNLIDAALLNEVERFIFVSSRTAGVHNGAYGLSKFLGERYLQNNFSNWIIFRPAEIYGGAKDEGIDKLIHDILNKNFLLCPAQVKNKLYPVFMIDVAKIMYDIVFKKKYQNKIITINGREGYSYIELAKHICQILSKKRPILPVPEIIMRLVGWIIKLTHVEMELIPDQIQRLYCKKDTQDLDYELVDIKSYLIKEFSGEPM